MVWSGSYQQCLTAPSDFWGSSLPPASAWISGVRGKQRWQGQEEAISSASLHVSLYQGDIALAFPTPACTGEPLGHILPSKANPSPAESISPCSICLCVCQLHPCQKHWAEARSSPHSVAPSLLPSPGFVALLFPAPLLSQDISSAFTFSALYLLV